MEKKKSPPIHGGNNVVPFTREKRSHSAEKNVNIEYNEVDVLICSLCGDNSFFLLNDQTGQIGCSSCGYLTGTYWTLKKNDDLQK
tara:strand:- start:485 stop:739 length:255 start_codon:yes stop_codon:yes gene_type:complete